MSDRVYEQLAEALDRLPNGFPRTASRVEIAILKKIFSPGEAGVAGLLSPPFQPAGEGAGRGGARPGIRTPRPPLLRVMPARRSVASEWILPYDDVRQIMLAARSFSANDCICRVQQDLLGHRCGFPLAMCLSFSNAERSALPGDISREEALALLDRSEEIGLVHTVSNVAQGVGYICNCCGCCCGILRGITDWGIENSVAHANYYAVIDPALCAGCGTCIERCQVHAIHDEEGVSVVAREKGIGCGLGGTGCLDNGPQLLLRPEAEMVHPPADFAAWGRERRRQRGP